jgi:hypothetical protein
MFWFTPIAFMRAFSTLFVPNGSSRQIKAYADLQRVATDPETTTKIRMIQDELDIRDILPKVRAPTLFFIADATTSYLSNKGDLLQLPFRTPGLSRLRATITCCSRMNRRLPNSWRR